MATDWQVGDLAVCVEAKCGGGHSTTPHREALTTGTIYHVVGVRCGPFSRCQAPVALWLAEFPNDPVGVCCARFRKVRPDEHEACEPEFVTLLKRAKRPVSA